MATVRGTNKLSTSLFLSSMALIQVIITLILLGSTRRSSKRQKVQAGRHKEVNGSNTLDQLWDQGRLETVGNGKRVKAESGTLSFAPDDAQSVVSHSVPDTNPSGQIVAGAFPSQSRSSHNSKLYSKTVTVVAKEIEEDIDWKLLDKYERSGSLKYPDDGVKLEDLYEPEYDILPKQEFDEVVHIPRGQVCCMINDVNNGIHPNSVAAKYDVSALVLVRMLARFAQMKIFETTPTGETPELFD